LPWFVEVVVPEVVGLDDLIPGVHPFAPYNIRWQAEEVVMFEVTIKVTPESNRRQGPLE
jgi:hypothetical protein